MSIITSIVIVTGCSSNMEEYLEQLNKYLVENKWEGFYDIEEKFLESLYELRRFKEMPTHISSDIGKYISGDKGLEISLIIGSFNGFPDYLKFIDYCKMKIRWRRKTIMILTDEHMDDDFNIYVLHE